MAKPGPVELSALASNLALAVIEAQRLFDRQYEADLVHAQPAAQALAEVFGLPGALSVLPARMAVDTTVYTLDVAVTTSRAIGFGVMVNPINLGFRITHESTEASESSIQFEVKQLPSPAASAHLQFQEGGQ